MNLWKNDDDKFSIKWGIFNVSLCKSQISKTGYIWRYAYFEGDRMKFLSSRSLVRLRKMVLDKDLEWVITNNKNAIDAYKLNKELNGDYDDSNIWSNKSSGVKYVYKHMIRRAQEVFIGNI
ncbi:hypothetical protein [uncultured Methanobrevibacter sp.]|uniref:hypothetical protein n=1 Tax=uncultured Methanobrevibacter sp. TaxID=253161 RepID=UPI0025EFFCF2|nr:hypothetical protein [uncultured Methanobrevibacter sp.]